MCGAIVPVFFSVCVHVYVCVCVCVCVRAFSYISLLIISNTFLQYSFVPIHFVASAQNVQKISQSSELSINCIDSLFINCIDSLFSMRGGGLGSRPQKMYGERLGDGVEYHLMKPTPRR